MANLALRIMITTLLLSSMVGSIVNPAFAQTSKSSHEPKTKPGIMLLIFDPIIQSRGNKTLVAVEGWNSPLELSRQYAMTLQETSGGYVNYVTMVVIEVDGYPVKSNGHIFTDEEYLQCLGNSSGPNCSLIIDYNLLLQDFGVCDLVNKNRISELWLWGGPWMGFYEAVQAGPDAISTNGPPVIGTGCRKTLDIMGFNYERGAPEMLESFAHRVEGNMVHVYGPRLPNENTPWNKFTLLDIDIPGRGGCGTAHLAVNASPGAQYDRENLRTVASDCDDFLNYPNLTGTFKSINCSAWGCTALTYLKWWLNHLPRANGQTNGKLNNWWKYVIH